MPAKPSRPNAFEQQLQFFASCAGDLDQLIVAMQVQRLGRPFVHGGAADCAIGRAEQAGEKAAGSGVADHAP